MGGGTGGLGMIVDGGGAGTNAQPRVEGMMRVEVGGMGGFG